MTISGVERAQATKETVATTKARRPLPACFTTAWDLHFLKNETMPASLHRGAAIGIQRVIRRKLLRHVLVVILAHRLKAGGQGVEAPRLGRELARVRVGAAHDARQRLERRIGALVLLLERVKRAALTVVPELHAGDAVGDRAAALGELPYLIRRDKPE